VRLRTTNGGSGKKRTSSSWSMQPLCPLNSTEPETIPFGQRLGRRIFPPVNLERSNLRLFKFHGSLGLQTSDRGQCSTASSVVLKELLTLHSFFAATLQNFSYKQVCSPHTMRVQAQGELLHQAHRVIPCTVIYPHIPTSTPLNNVDQVGQACGNCGRAHPPRACPAYKDLCKFCGKIGH